MTRISVKQSKAVLLLKLMTRADASNGQLDCNLCQLECQSEANIVNIMKYNYKNFLQTVILIRRRRRRAMKMTKCCCFSYKYYLARTTNRHLTFVSLSASHKVQPNNLGLEEKLTRSDINSNFNRANCWMLEIQPYIRDAR